MAISLPVVPRTKDMNDVSWLFKTRRYISKYDVYDAYKSLYGKEPKGIPTTEELVKVFEQSEEKETRVTLKIVSHSFEEHCVDEYINEGATKQLGIALAIEFRMLKEIINIADDSDIFLYLTEYSLNEEELSLIAESGLMKSLSKRIIDRRKVMYTTLTENFEKLLKMNDCGVIDSNFISGYIEHASFYDGNLLLKYILEEFTDSHPLFAALDCLAWDPFTKSRRYRHWIEASNRMNELSKYYQEINGEANNINKNREYISEYQRFRTIYSEDF
ncbi:hypothetical protein [Psychrobium sp. 1_MG-2023]|uniref:hypothetical protein n=1 Tax=Psychrobium sp. 1_MG-2023 TaxID=3062624 RepID=UPI000C32A530|nr:hypothetical protein [Psychrobium sp. 1_MG-2023]MDP2562132.1 hypothetical protein [Psychrobium sp. 1_MG-2023]PKF57191.1 hypothetical protein CW748_07340 [Alteromonadales bacterium alter-6D02]